MEGAQFVEVQGQGYAIIKPDGGLVPVQRIQSSTHGQMATNESEVLGLSANQRTGEMKEQTGAVQLVLESGDRQGVNILEYLKSEMMETDKKGFSNKENGAMLTPYDKDISLKIEVLQEEKSLTVDTKKRKKDKAKLFRPKNYVCSECGMGFVSSKDLNRHRVVHTGEKPFECPYCDQKFTAPSSRATHIRTIHERSQAYACPQCEKTFNQKSNMIKHYKTIHLETVVIVCQECGREFNQASALRRHVKIVHKKELPHVCQCGKRFALAESLKKHMEAIHLKSRAYPCSYCDYAASRADMLKIHVRKIHTKEWSYKCNICEEKGVEWGCILPKELRRHLQTRHPTQYQLQVEVAGEDAARLVARLHEDRRLKTAPEASPANTVETVKTKASEARVSMPVAPGDIDERVQQLLGGIRQPLQFSDQLEAEVRARACRAPACVLAGSSPAPREAGATMELGPRTVVMDGSGAPYTVPEVTTVYRQVAGPGQGERWQVVSQETLDQDIGPATVLLSRGDGQQPLKLFYDYQRN